jgi:DNA-binding response OmpR family regulator
MQVLVVEDERKVADAIREGLEAEQYDVAVERNGDDAFARINTDAFDLVLLDLGLPGRDGLEVLGAIRRRNVRTPILVLTARDTLQDRVIGLNAGADDYLVKPFAFAELLARVRALLRRGAPREIARLTVGSLTIDCMTRRVTRGDDQIELTTKEFELLDCLMRCQGQVVSREALARDVWKETSRSTSLDNVIDVHITRLRRKVDCDPSARLIHTVRGVGFIVNDGEP